VKSEEDAAFRPEIQRLRGVAVVLVVVFHIWPSVLPGGYVGVDVFFVISGYLITGLLARTAMRDGDISLIDFYSRRVRRLLPAAILALLVTLVGTLVFLSKARWEETAIQIAASALYVQNWRLAWLAVDYLGAEQAASPVQHYWSLSIEEQFYIVWPLLMVWAIWAARRLGQSLTRALLVTLTLVFTSSIIASVLTTANDPAEAYFVTQTRLWELALGGLLALTIHRIPAARYAARVAFAALGAGAIACSAVFFSGSTAFPGVNALLPTLGTVLIIVAGDIRVGRFLGLDLNVLRYLGDRSYSIYLWHWPLIIFYASQHPVIGLAGGIGLMVLTIGISHLSYRYVEQRFRRPAGRSKWRSLVHGSLSIFVCVVVSGGFGYALDVQGIDTTLIGTRDYPGPAALLSGAAVPSGVEPLPPLIKLDRDVPVVYRLKCHQKQERTEPVSCVLGDPNGTRTVVVTGDSHAAQWIPALDKIARDRKWKLVTFTKAECPFSRVTVLLGGKPYLACDEWREKAIIQIMKLKPDMMVTSQSGHPDIKEEMMIEGLRSIWGELNESGVQIIAIRNTPRVRFNPGDCLAAKPEKCATTRKDIEPTNILALAARPLKGVRVVDMTNAICGTDTCQGIVGNIVVWRDHHHMTATYSLALAPYLAKSAGL
jgi:peptidoglycan/LPS O-acetylase OafA/YrhL